MLDLKNHPYFREYKDPKSGVVSYFLTEKVASLQQHFYFTNTSLTYDGKYLWIRCIDAPAMFQYLAVVSMDAENPFIRRFPHAGWSGDGNLPSIIPGTHDVIFATYDTVYKIDVEGNLTPLIVIGQDILGNREAGRLFTHASLSPDNKKLVMDIEIADKTYIVIGDIETGEYELLHKFARCYNHAMFSPVHDGIILLDQDWWRDKDTGDYFGIDNRMWIMSTDKTRFEPILKKTWYRFDGTEYAHDFWAPDGKLCWVDYYSGAYECDIEECKPTHVWKRTMCHCHTVDHNLWCADETPYTWKERPCQTLFYDRETNKEIDIISANPMPKVERKGGTYHLDPHPSFTTDGKYIISTTTLLEGNADVAITPVEPLLKLCREKGKIVE